MIRALTNQVAQPAPTTPAAAPADVKESAPAEPKEQVVLNFVHVNDTHGVVEPICDSSVSEDSRVGGLARLKTVIDDQKAQNPEGTLVLHAGDHAEGSMIAYLSKGEVVREATSDWFDGVCPGNHDHAWGAEAMQNLFGGIRAPKLCCNVVRTSDGKPLEGFEPYHIFERKGVKIAVIGVNTPEVPHYVEASKLAGMEFRDPAESIAAYLPEMKEQGAEVFVVLSHTGFEQPDKSAASDINTARTLAEKRRQNPDLPKVHLIIGAHTHHRLQEGHQEGDTLIVQAGALTEFAGNAQLVYDPTKREVVAHEARLIPVVADQVEPDAEVEAILRPYLDEAREIGSRVMGQTTEPLQHAHREAAKVNQIHADSLLNKTDAEIVVCNSRTLRADLPEGDVSYEQLYAALPFTEDSAVTMSATGKMVRAEIEDCLKDGARELAVPAGLKYTYDETRPNGDRIVSLTKANGEAIEDDQWYRVGMNWTMGNKSSWEGCRDRRVVGSCQDLFFEAFSEGGPWKNDPDDRVARLNS